MKGFLTVAVGLSLLISPELQAGVADSLKPKADCGCKQFQNKADKQYLQLQMVKQGSGNYHRSGFLNRIDFNGLKRLFKKRKRAGLPDGCFNWSE